MIKINKKYIHRVILIFSKKTIKKEHDALNKQKKKI